MSERKLATLRTVADITPIAGADAIELAIVDGWQVVVKKGEFKPGDQTVFFEIDSFLPANDERYAFLAKNAIFYSGKTGIRLKTVKLRGQISQGLALPVSSFPEVDGTSYDLTEQLGITLWEKPEQLGNVGNSRGGFPHFIRKTDQERVQNMTIEVNSYQDEVFEITEKLDGSSMTVYVHEGEVNVCSRNMRLVENPENRFWATAIKYKVGEALKALPEGTNVALQGELCGPGIQGNIYKLLDYHFYVYNVWSIDLQRYLTPGERSTVLSALAFMGYNIEQVPNLGYRRLGDIGGLDAILNFADGSSALNTQQKREGLVFKHMNNSNMSFKAISNKFLLKEAA